MAFPENRLSTEPVPSQWIGAGGEALASRIWDAEDGPIAEQDPSKGHRYQQWRAYLQDYKIILEADNTPPRTLIDSPDNTITDISICFNQNANLHYAWVDAGVARFRWYDTLAASMQTMQLPAGVRTPKITLDDKRPTQSGRSDVILSYIKPDNKLYFRMQRERFQIEHLLDEGPFISIERLYMNAGYRLQWLLTRGSV